MRVLKIPWCAVYGLKNSMTIVCTTDRPLTDVVASAKMTLLHSLVHVKWIPSPHHHPELCCSLQTATIAIVRVILLSVTHAYRVEHQLIHHGVSQLIPPTVSPLGILPLGIFVTCALVLNTGYRRAEFASKPAKRQRGYPLLFDHPSSVKIIN